MMDRTGWKRFMQCVSLVLFLAVLALSAAELLMPETGKKTKKNGDMTVDMSHMEDGYIHVKATKGKKKYKLRMKKGDVTLNYDLNNNGTYEVFPLQYGNGNYTFTLYKNVSGKKYAEAGKMSIKANMKDENRCFLYPNQYVNYDKDTLAVKEAMTLCEGMTEQKEIFDAVCKYMETHFHYDFIKSYNIQPGMMPDMDGAWKKQMGICQDLAAIMVSMLRSQGVPARFVIGTLGKSTYHAWVVAIVDGEDQFFDPTAAANGVDKNSTYTTERYY